MRVETCHFCSRPVYPSKGISFVRLDSKMFRFCRSKCHKNFKMKRQPRKLKWTKTSRAANGKEMIVDSSLVLSQFAKKRNAPVKYDRNLVAATVKAMERVEEIRQRRERAFTKRRLAGKVARDRKREADRRVVAEGEHLIRKELRDREEGMPLVQEGKQNKIHSEERPRQKKRTRVLVDGTTQEEMDVD
ncbi:ribosomal protein L24e-domain-containing protein [Aspergillus parasiticus]|uniref:Ribosome biogenesis protein RLP24 n=4 Tax=Aspergillus subgen. Circumdati TaxID=2720871 RepID=A0A5N6DFX6_ASPPA|nr:ribosomal protein L24e-domain-containing protein [Aspergillus parasiticus]KAB8215775.1 ribosomal protein L24e-domain-containing protein [Aspergillus novoparasiticus]KAE8309594.1 ribosomal protein L24e-domain-containing protein [Aspergillus transmontanensis]KAE8322856.1 ribosomal protein L24e-domain-containing protein [Aspergillus sergii]